MLLRKPRAYAEVYNDMDDEVTNLFRVARDQGDALVRALELTPFSRTEFREAYEFSDDPLERARRLVVRSFQGFAAKASTGNDRCTGFRSNSNRAGSTPATDWRRYPGCLPAIIERLQGVVIEHRPALQVIANHDSPETVFYIDPPYMAETRDAGKDYKHELTDSEHVELARILQAIKGIAVVSGYDSPLYSELYQGWTKLAKEAYADGARPRTEVLWISPGANQMRLL